MSQVTAHTHVWATSTTQSFRDDPPGRVINLSTLGRGPALGERGAGRMWNIAGDKQRTAKSAKRKSQSHGRPRGRRGRHRCLKGGDLETRRATCQYMPVTRPARCRHADAYTHTPHTGTGTGTGTDTNLSQMGIDVCERVSVSMCACVCAYGRMWTPTNGQPCRCRAERNHGRPLSVGGNDKQT